MVTLPKEVDMENFVSLPFPLDLYKISKSGKVIDTRTMTEVVPTIGERSEYIGVTIRPRNSKRSVTMHLHRLLAMAFIPNNTYLPIEKLHVNHIDGNKLNNNLSNLEWVTRSGNCFHAYKTGLRKDNKEMILVNAENPKDVREVYSLTEAARMIGVNPASLHEYLHTPRRLGTAIRGFIVRYKDPEETMRPTD